MGVNKYKPHVIIMPEDRANQQIVNGFLLHEKLDPTAIQVLGPAGGWLNVIDGFRVNLQTSLEKYPGRHVVLLMDCDGDIGRLEAVKKKIPASIADRVFVLGADPYPEALKAELGPFFEDVGKRLAADCWDNTDIAWAHNTLRHNQAEIQRMSSALKPILFPHQ
jgi:hypothetical protein